MAKIKNTYKRAPLTKDEIRACLSDFSVFCEKCLLIDDKNGRKIPFVLNRAQRYFAELLLKHVFSTNPQPVTVVVLKARQMGYSTLLCALELYILIRFENNEYASLNLKHFLHLGSMADEMLQDKMLPMIESMHQTFFGDFYMNKDERKISCVGFKGQRRNNKIRYYTANSGESGRGGTAQILVIDEAGYVKDLGQLQRAVGSATPTVGLGLQVFVSTANGINSFYDLCNLAQSDPKMEFMFLPWFLMEDYVLPPDDVDEDNLLDYEKRMIEEMKKWELPEHLHLAKIAWYRDHLVSKKGNDLSAMRQEFPTTWQEPFISSDSPAFPTEKLLSMLSEEDREPLGYAINNPDGKIIEGKEWDIRIYKKPQPGKKYDMIIDPAFGGAEADNTAIRVVEQRTLEDCAVYGTKDEPSDVAELAVALARYYNNAIVNIEKNRGELMLSYMRNLRYNNFYIDRARFIKSDPFKSIGTNITKTTREKGIQRLRALITTGQFTTKDEETLQELLHFNYVGTGASRKAQACGNKPDGTPYHDDHVMALVNWALMLPKSLFINER